MNMLYRVIVPLAVIASLSVGLLAALPATAHADTTTANTCSVTTVGTKDTAGNANSRFALNSDNTVSATVVVKGDASCQQAVTLTSWEAPDALKGQPYSEQQLFAHTTDTLGVGTYTISVALPDCFYQVDLVKGTNPTGPNNSAVYTVGSLLGSLHGGAQQCTTPTPTTPSTPAGPQTPVAPAALPNTGVGSMPFVAAGAMAVVGTAFGYLRQLRSRSSFGL